MIRLLIVGIILLSNCASSKKTYKNITELNILNAKRQQSTMGYQNTSGSSTTTTYSITYEKNDDVKIQTVYIYGVPYLYQNFITDKGENLIVVSIATNKIDENIDKTKSQIKTESEGLIGYSINGENKTKFFIFNENETIQNK